MNAFINILKAQKTHGKVLENGGLLVKHQAGFKTSTLLKGLIVQVCQSAVNAFLLAL